MYFISMYPLVFFFLFSIFHHLPCASSKLELCETLFECGNITAGFPFWGGTRHRNCGHPLLELLCNKNSSTSIIISDQEYSVFHLNQTSNTIKLTRPDFLGSFCSSAFTNTTLPPQIFELLPTYKNITVFYHCDPFLPYLSSHTCPKIGLISLSENHNGTCRNGFTVNVPKSFIATEKKLNMTNLESVLSKGFEVKLKIDRKACQQCLSTHGSCGFNQTLPLRNKCNPLHPQTKSVGACGNNQTLSRFVCYHNHTSGYGPRMSDGLSSGSVVDSGDHVVTSTAVAIGCAAGVIFLAAFITVCLHCQQISHDPAQQNLKTVPQPNIEPYNPLKKYSYAQVTRITKSFAEVVGKGGFGTVYRGTLCDGRIVAVKVLKDSKGNGEDFLTEVATISQTSHVNIVTLLGFCSEGSKRAIIYEFLGNGSLDKFISSKTTVDMDWPTLYGIALGVARGLEYLHHGCRTRIVHFDIKPQNILLDDNLCPKVADFGLAKLCERKESILSLLDTRGTIGYIAPELFSRMYGRVSHKSDVYSYGMLVLEMIGARNKERAAQNSASDASSIYFPEWIYKDIEKGDTGRLNMDGIVCKEEEMVRKMTLVGLWCIQSSPIDRPPMNRVVEMMEGSVDALKVPPRPGLQVQVAPLQESSTLSENISVYTEYDP
ncbi:LEAF RUST 10 DISEASE-RESISTANCE LOCUS RECEPTOR-LIKE PROTEIN KINASE-like 2.4 isoform X1 [Brassica rapa]|uniref:LEAF RUST 10 DISEASE-RESISTANCE LOCUS RECEPTOR-LIKE PROTEIN KINASE-like 2.4 isoform X1 n=1 Tax=Brassica campestris TaxID=3711 RepID=UPI0004F1C13F|nr:LEAF RUST 10 DISEASE-RESISTANCE LOCUS RECEPTOR-LIKE PROTEIN KINASE-like 2.4 isoform X1 [Brassica rapa]